MQFKKICFIVSDSNFDQNISFAKTVFHATQCQAILLGNESVLNQAKAQLFYPAAEFIVMDTFDLDHVAKTYSPDFILISDQITKSKDILKISEHYSIAVMVLKGNSINGNILVPLDDSIATRQKVPYSILFAKMLYKSINIYGLTKSSSSSVQNTISAYCRQTDSFIESKGVNSGYNTIFNEKPLDSILKLTQNDEYSIVSCMTETETSGWFASSFCSDLIDKCSISIIIVPSKDLFLTGDAGY